MLLLDKIISVFSGKPLRPKDAVAYQRALSLTPEEVSRPHPAGGKRPPDKPREQKPDKSPLEAWIGPGKDGTPTLVSAHTKSEARARLKNILGVKRLPPGTIVEKVPS